jgi:putative ABC transport system permease protein
MNLVRDLPLLLRNAVRNRRRSLLTVLSVAVSICLLGVMLSLYHSFFLRPPDEGQSLRLVTINRVSIMTVLPISYGDKIRRISGVTETTSLQWFGGTYKDNRDVRNMFARFSVDPKKLFVIYPEYSVPEDQKQAFLADRRGCIVGRPLAERLGLKLGDHVLIEGDIYPVNLDLIVKAIYDSLRDNENLFFHSAYLEESAPDYRDFAMLFVSRAEDGTDLRQLANVIDATFRNSMAETRTDTERAFEVSFLSYLGNVKMFIFAVAIALTFTILLVLANSMAMSARERVREMGVMRTLGFTPGSLFVLLVGEAVVLALAGGLCGVLLAEAICAGLRAMPSIFVDLKPVRVTPLLACLCLAVAAAIGAISSSIPAWGTSRKPITEALRFVD